MTKSEPDSLNFFFQLPKIVRTFCQKEWNFNSHEKTSLHGICSNVEISKYTLTTGILSALTPPPCFLKVKGGGGAGREWDSHNVVKKALNLESGTLGSSLKDTFAISFNHPVI